MWSDAFAVLDRAERLRRVVFRPPRSRSRLPVWEPPVDVFETFGEVIVLVALPGVDATAVEVCLEDGVLIFAGTRIFPEEMGAAVIHRLELPQGRFERHVQLPPGRYAAARRSASNGCLAIVLEKLETPGD
jgi:HSP20 family molecular chaperone IbpA